MSSILDKIKRWQNKRATQTSSSMMSSLTKVSTSSGVSSEEMPKLPQPKKHRDTRVVKMIPVPLKRPQLPPGEGTVLVVHPIGKCDPREKRMSTSGIIVAYIATDSGANSIRALVKSLEEVKMETPEDSIFVDQMLCSTRVLLIRIEHWVELLTRGRRPTWNLLISRMALMKRVSQGKPVEELLLDEAWKVVLPWIEGEVRASLPAKQISEKGQTTPTPGQTQERLL
ncbi:C protein [Salmon aquaparamyxovirus]|uniref:C protein n=2 Tax=Salmon aquaparamyxovirus TaxID=381543 RepID=B1NLR2_9MONO|nr:C protein [Salmon aquaparamyxovirus]ABW38050.1 C protein [Salmon aquaparamyxovirus]ACB78119.1 C protein [Salmon aquaparamyxovirus]